MTVATATANAGGQTATTESSSSLCGRCGHALHPDEAVWLRRLGRHLDSVCWRCQDLSASYWPERPCGSCQRPVSAVSWAAWASTVVFCSRGCRPEGRREVPRQWATCGKDFTPKRRDALTCSAACRQKGYRQRRVTANRTATGGAQDNRNGKRSIPAFLDRRSVTDVVGARRFADRSRNG